MPVMETPLVIPEEADFGDMVIDDGVSSVFGDLNHLVREAVGVLNDLPVSIYELDKVGCLCIILICFRCMTSRIAV